MLFFVPRSGSLLFNRGQLKATDGFCLCLCVGSGITHEEMVQESKRHWHRLEQNAQRQKVRLNNNTVLSHKCSSLMESCLFI